MMLFNGGGRDPSHPVEITLKLLETLKAFPELHETIRSVSDKTLPPGARIDRLCNLCADTKRELCAAKAIVDGWVENGDEDESAARHGDETALDPASLLACGNKFEGTIKIPVPASSSNDEHTSAFGARVPYYMLVSRRFTDAFGEEQVVVWHGAHEDEQACLLHAEKIGNSNETLFKVRFGDIETKCDGIADLQRREISGTVAQLIYGEGYVVKADSSVHTFTLKLENANPTSIGKGRALAHLHMMRLKFAFIMAFFLSCHPMLSEIAQEIQKGRLEQIILELADFAFNVQPKGQVRRDLGRFLSQLNAILLNHSHKLSRMEFNSKAEKERQLGEIQDGGAMSRSHIQHSWDAVNRLSVFFSRFERARTATYNEYADNWLAQTIRRVHWSYERFDAACRQAENQPTNDALARFKINIEDQQGDESQGTCCICLCTILPEDDDDMKDKEEEGVSEDSNKQDRADENDLDVLSDSALLKLPCSHVFHFECAKEWLKRNCSCPQCRRQISDAETSS